MTIDNEYFKKVMTTVIVIALVVLSFYILKPILVAIITGVLLAFIFNPLFNLFYKWTKSKNLAVSLVCFLLIVFIVLILWFLTPIVIEQTFKIYDAAQTIDFGGLFQSIAPNLFNSPVFAAKLSSITSSFISKTTNSILNEFSDILLNLPSVLLQLLIVAFTFFFVLRDKDEIIEYIKSILPFSKDVEKKLFESSKEITYSVLYGHIAIGVLQGLIVGLSFFIFGVPNALFLTLLACLVAVVPVLGAPFVWIPVVIYLFLAGNTGAAWGVTGFGLFAGIIDNIIRPFIISKKARLSTLLITIGMVGGLFYFGFLGFLIGPLILAYLVIVLEIYRDKKSSVSAITASVAEK